MDWKHIQFDWNRARAFLVVAEEGSFSAAGRAMNISQPTLGRQIAAFEQELNVTLFERVGKKLVLTESGSKLYQHVSQMAESANQMLLTALGQDENIAGDVSISLTELDAFFRFPPLISQLREYAPNINIELIVSNQVSDLKRREADIAIRYQRPTDLDLIARKIGHETVHLYGNKSLVQSFSNKSPSEVSNVQIIGFERGERLKQHLDESGWLLKHNPFNMICSNQLVQWQLAQHTPSLILVPDHIAQYNPNLTIAFKDHFKPFELDAWLVCHRELHTNKRVKLVFDFLAKYMRL
ncbi:LysR family transcriptional regulator [Vibrio brasiliensis]|uniref:LysR family transcriptional regulator n=1 Tax=Vibrio brasiliensis LMG 20546 TaxID=945543 RepID=E8LWU6_9VIBR|nr:LysR family transcriptional regulator [Vibrio brasiliensis]EGA64847.1 LysR family transcriptional regulator [Vibrio brasiliensis LMG 20546]MCG9649383.1 LysR family transcriptional regulator [Vibrio brasiliensis]MCG9751226.1 LysR family transcriptional regulator [Vibrio brasiliensis]MCG9782543.1 LysR family transcriptional regulator [Vibrio brasiliensis]